MAPTTTFLPPSPPIVNPQVGLSIWLGAIQDKPSQVGLFYHDRTVSTLLTPHKILVDVPATLEVLQGVAARVFKSQTGNNYDHANLLCVKLPNLSYVKGRKKQFNAVRILQANYSITENDLEFADTRDLIIIEKPEDTSKIEKGVNPHSRSSSNPSKKCEEESDKECNEIKLTFILGGVIFDGKVLAERSNRKESPCVRLGNEIKISLLPLTIGTILFFFRPQ